MLSYFAFFLLPYIREKCNYNVGTQGPRGKADRSYFAHSVPVHIKSYMHGIMYQMRYTIRLREFYALLAFLVGISIGFLLTARARVSLVSTSGILISSPILGCNTNSEFRQDHEKSKFSVFVRAVNVNESWAAPPLADVPVGPNEKVLRMMRDGSAGRNLILVGVMTAQKYLDTRAIAVYRTWARTLAGQVVFFSSATAQAPPELPIVRMAGVDDTYPPQKKSFLMLKYMHDNFLDKFEWFMRADDDVYIRGGLLERLLRSVNSSRPQFIGQAGMGNKEEFGQLNLDYNENFCMGGPGIVFSRETLKRVAPHVRECLKNLYSTHEDVEVGRCVRQFAGIPCTWSYEMQNIFYHNSSENAAFTGNLKQKEVHRAITLHPIKQHFHLYRLHNYLESLRVQELNQRTLILHRDLVAIQKTLGWGTEPSWMPSMDEVGHYRGNSSELGKAPCLNKNFPKSDSEVLKWDFIHRTWYSFTNSNPRRKMEQPLKETLDDIIIQIMEMINRFSKQRGRVIDFKDILYGYQRVDPQHGADYILDLLLVYKKYRGRKMTIPVRKHVYLQQTFTEPEFRESPTAVGSPKNANLPSDVQRAQYEHSSNNVIHFILPLAGRFPTFRRFLETFEEVCLLPGEHVSLTVVLFSVSEDSVDHRETGNIPELLKQFRAKYSGYSLEVVQVSGVFSRAVALQTGAERLGPNELLFFVDVDMKFDKQFLRRVQRNTIQGEQVYFPIVFSQYDPGVKDGKRVGEAEQQRGTLKAPSVINDALGYWRQFGFGIVSLYNSDLKGIGGLDTTIQGWGKEDVDLYDKVVRSNLSIFRAADPGLLHVFHPIECDRTLDRTQLSMCLGSQANSYAGIVELAKLIYNDSSILKFAHSDKTLINASEENAEQT